LYDVLSLYLIYRYLFRGIMLLRGTIKEKRELSLAPTPFDCFFRTTLSSLIYFFELIPQFSK